MQDLQLPSANDFAKKIAVAGGGGFADFREPRPRVMHVNRVHAVARDFVEQRRARAHQGGS